MIKIKAIILIGGGEINKRETELIDIEALKLTKKKNPKVLFVPIAAFDSESYAESFKEYYESLNATVEVCFMSKENKHNILNKFKHTDAIYLSGGDTEKLISEFKKYPELTKLLKNKVLIGMSAGALALSGNCFISKDKDQPITKIIKGLDIINFTTEVHYDDNPSEILKVTSNQDIFAISENSAIILTPTMKKYIGHITIFYKNAKN